MSEHTYTLVIVESPTVARLLNRFELPWVEVLPTHGFCWRPHYNRQKHTLGKRAVPERLEERNRIRQTAQWAARTIIATDTDSSGTFLAWALTKDLKDAPLYRGNLQGISKTSLQQIIEEATPITGSTHRELEQRFQLHELAQRYLKPVIGDLPMVKLALIHYSQQPHSFVHFRDDQGRPWFSNQAIERLPGESFYIQPGHEKFETYWEPALRPPSTARALQILKRHDSGTTFHQLQERLNHLFTTIPEELPSGLISYPRTAAGGFYSSTWQRLFEQHIATKSAESFRPQALWFEADSSQPHEGIHPLGNFSPTDIRPHVPKVLYDDFRALHQYHQKLLSPPEKISEARIFESRKFKGIIFARQDHQIHQPMNLQPKTEPADIVRHLTQTGVISPSKAGSILDQLIRQNWLEYLPSGHLEPGSAPETILGRTDRIDTAVALFKELQDMQQNGRASYNNMESCILDHLSGLR